MRREILSTMAGVIVAVILVVLLSNGAISLSDVSAAIAYVLVATVVGILLFGWGPKIKWLISGRSGEAYTQEIEETAIDPKFAHLTVHYSRIRGEKDAPDPNSIEIYYRQ